MAFQLPTDAAGLIAFLINIGIEVSEDDAEKIKANVAAAKAENDAAVDANRAGDAPQE